MKNLCSYQVMDLVRTIKILPIHQVAKAAVLKTVALVALILVINSHETVAQWLPGYSYKGHLTIQGAEICGVGTLTNFPVLINLSDDVFKTAPAGLVVHPNGFDIAFTAGDQTTILNHEIESYDAITGTFSAWVSMPALTANVDTDIYFYYGNPSVVSDPSTTSTWDPSFRTIYHFNNNNFNDATPNGINSINSGTTNIPGKIGDARDFDGASNYIQSASNELTTANNFTISVWFKADVVNPAHIIWQGVSTENGWGNGVGGAQEMNLSTGTCCPGSLAQNDYVSYFLGDREEQASTDVLSVETAFTNTTTWQYAVATVSNLDTSPHAEIFLNGASIGTNVGVANALTARNLWNSNLLIGRPGANARFFNGQIDEVRISNTVRSADWVCTEFNNQNNPDVFSNLVNHAPDLATIETSALNFIEGNAPIALTSTLTVSDWEQPMLSGASISITGNYNNGEDVLQFTNAYGVTGSFDATTGILILTGTATFADYQLALRSVTYQNTNTDNPSTLTRTLNFTVTDGTDNSASLTRDITLTAIDDAPIATSIEVTPLGYAEDQPATQITSSIAVTDDNAIISSAEVRISTNYNSAQDILAYTNMLGISGVFTPATGTLTLTGTATPADYETALRSVTYSNTNGISPSVLTRTVSFTVGDGVSTSNTLTRNISVNAVNDPPVLALIEPAALNFNEGGLAMSMTATTTVSDADHAVLLGATIQITANYIQTEDVLTFTTASGITGVYDATTGTMTLSGAASVANYRTAILAVRYRNTNTNDPSALTRVVSFTVTDGVNLSNTVTRDINVIPSNDVPVLSAAEGATLAYTEDQGPVGITSTLVVTDVDNATLPFATVRISNNYNSAQDVLAFGGAFGITSSYNSGTGTLTLTGPASTSDFQAALRMVTYENTNTFNPSIAVRTITFRTNDGTVDSNTQTRTITITLTNDAPVLSSIEATSLTYSEGQSAVAVTGTIAAADDNTNLTGATVQITGNYINTEDVLSFTNTAAITGSFDAATGTMTLTGTTTVVNFRNALRSVRYRNTNTTTPSPLTRTVTYTVSDAAFSSNPITRDINVVPVNDVPLAANETVTTVEETDIIIDVLLNDSDVDDALDPTTVVITTQPVNGTAVVDPVTGAITYSPNINFSGANTIRYTVKDMSGGTSNIATVTVNVTNINDVPFFSVGPNQTINEDAGTQTITGWATGVSDGDPFTSQSLTFVLSNTHNALFAAQPSVNSSGTLSYRTATNAPNIATTVTVTIFLRDNGSNTAPNVNESASQTFTITILPLNDAPNAVADFYSTSSNTPVAANLRSNDTDADSNPMIVTTTPVVAPVHGSVVISANGTFTYTPNGSSIGEDTFIYEICDNGNDNGVPAPKCSQAMVTITINDPNSEYNIVGNNSIQIDTHCFILTKALNNQQGAVWHREPLDLRYSFELYFDSMFSDTAQVRDTGADGILFALQRDYTPPPLSVPASPIDARGAVGEYLGIGGVTPSIGIEVDTYQNGGEPAFDHIAISKNGSVYDIISPAVPAKVDGTNTPLNIEDGITHTVRISWDKPTNTLRVYFDGVERTSYTGDIVTDIFAGDPTNIFWGFSASTGGQNNYQAVCGLTMNTINLSPVTQSDAASTSEDIAVTGSLLGNDFDPEGGSVIAKPETKTTAHGHVVINANGTYTYTPSADYNGTDTFTYESCDNFSVPGCTQTSVVITVDPINDAPRPQDDLIITNEENTVAFDILANDVDIDNAINSASVNITITSAHGTTTVDPLTGYVTYTPDADYAGSDSFSYTISDVTGAISNAATVTINVAPVNDAPEAFDDQMTTRQVPVAIMVLNNDSDIDDALNTCSIIITSNPSYGTLTINSTTGAITYVPNAEYLGSDKFSYQLQDIGGLFSNIVEVSVNVTPANKPPLAIADGPITFSLLLPITIDVLGNDSDPDHAHDELQIVSVGNPTKGTVRIDNGVLIYTPSGMSASEVIQFTYTIQDPEGLTAEAIVLLDFVYQPLHVSQGFSPNGDGSNDYWYIRSIENFPNNQLRVFNRWGLLVYTSTNYDNKTVFWDGRANTGTESSNLVDQGTYFYTLDLKDSGNTLSGYVVIVK